MGLAQKAAASAAPSEGGDTFTKPDLSAVPLTPEQKDQADRIVAAGMKMMLSPQMRDDLKKAMASPEPTPKVLSENVVGLMLTMDSKAGKSGLPQEAIMPAAVELLGEAGQLMVDGGRPVSQEDFKTAIQMTFVLISKKMGMDDAQIMDTANKALPADQQVAGGAPPDGPAADASAAAPPAGGPPVAAAPAGVPPAATAGAPGAPPIPEEEV